MASAFNKWYEANYRKIAATSSWPERARQTWDAALEEAAKEIKQRFVERNQFGEMVYCADLEQVVRELKEQK
jgi:hypothetical protein